MKINKTLILALAAIVLVVVFFYLPKFSSETPAQPIEIETTTAKTASVAVDFGDDSAISNEFEINSETTAYSLLQEIAQTESLELATEQYDFGIFVKAVNGYESTAERSWIYFVNGTSGDIAADQKKINAGETVEWKYLEPNE